MTVDLKFESALNTAHPVNLTFGAGADVVVTYSYLTLSATLPAPMGSGMIQPAVLLQLAAMLPAPTMLATLAYDNAVFRGVVGETASSWQVAKALAVKIEDHVESVKHLHARTQSNWQKANPVQKSTAIILGAGLSAKAASLSAWGNGIAVHTVTSSTFGDMLRAARPLLTVPHQVARPVSSVRFSGWQDLLRISRPRLDTTWGSAVPRAATTLSRSGVALPLTRYIDSRWQVARKPGPGKHTHPVIPFIPPCYTPPRGAAVHLLFSEAFVLSSDILFTCAHSIPPATQIVPVRRTYIVINEVSLRRVDGNHILPDVSISLNIDMDSWTWKFSASLPASTLPLIEPGVTGDPVVLEATINGNVYLLLAEGVQRDRQFGKSSITVTGRGQSAMLADPYSPILSYTNTIERTARQLMDDALTTNGVPIGWDIDWRIDDWVVPSGVWTHQGTYMSAVTTIANAAGAFIQPDPVNKVLRVRPRFPAKPWEWNAATPDLQLPSAVIVKESIAWMDKPAYNAIYVSGTTAGGILGHVKRTGSAGDVIAPMVTDALITDAIAARQRALSVLADTGRCATYSLSLPVLLETGIIDPGTLVRYVDGSTINGVVKGVSVSASLNTVRQTIEVQTYG